MNPNENGSIVADTGKRLASKAQIGILRKADAERVQKMMEYYKVDKLEDLTIQQASQAIEKLKQPIAPKEESVENA